MTDTYRAGDTYSYRSVATMRTVTWTRDVNGIWSSPDRTMTASDDDVEAQRKLDEMGLPDAGTFERAGRDVS